MDDFLPTSLNSKFFIDRFLRTLDRHDQQMAAEITWCLQNTDFARVMLKYTPQERETVLWAMSTPHYHPDAKHLCPLLCNNMEICPWPYCRIILKAVACIQKFPPNRYHPRLTLYEHVSTELINNGFGLHVEDVPPIAAKHKSFGMYMEDDIQAGEYLFPLIGTIVDRANIMELGKAIYNHVSNASQMCYVLQLPDDSFLRCVNYRDARSLLWKHLSHNKHGANCTAFVCKDRQGTIMVIVRARVAIPKYTELAINFREHGFAPGIQRLCQCADICQNGMGKRKYTALMIPDESFVLPKMAHNL